MRGTKITFIERGQMGRKTAKEQEFLFELSEAAAKPAHLPILEQLTQSEQRAVHDLQGRIHAPLAEVLLLLIRMGLRRAP